MTGILCINSVTWDNFIYQGGISLHYYPSLWPSGILAHLGWNRLRVWALAVSDTYPKFIELLIAWVPSGFSGCIWLDAKIVFKKNIYIYILTSNVSPSSHNLSRDGSYLIEGTIWPNWGWVDHLNHTESEWSKNLEMASTWLSEPL